MSRPSPCTWNKGLKIFRSDDSLWDEDSDVMTFFLANKQTILSRIERTVHVPHFSSCFNAYWRPTILFANIAVEYPKRISDAICRKPTTQTTQRCVKFENFSSQSRTICTEFCNGTRFSRGRKAASSINFSLVCDTKSV